MPGLEEDPEFLYSRGVFEWFSSFEPSLGGKSPAPTPSMICIHGLTPPQRAIWGDTLDNSSNASDIIEVLLFLELFLRMSCSSHMGTFDGKPGNKKKLGRLFLKTFFGLFTLVIWLYNVYFGCLFTKCGFYHVIWKFPVIFQNSRISTSISIGRHIYWEKCVLNFISWSLYVMY